MIHLTNTVHCSNRTRTGLEPDYSSTISVTASNWNGQELNYTRQELFYTNTELEQICNYTNTELEKEWWYFRKQALRELKKVQEQCSTL